MKSDKKKKEIEMMIKTLELHWGNQIHYTCLYCLKEAYNSVINHKNGYITDDELIKSSNGKIKHK